MSQTAITFAFEQWKAQEAATGQLVVLDEFVLAYVPGLDHTVPIDRAETLPPAAQIVHRQSVNKIGVVNDNAVVYSVTMGTEVGDFDFNWIGLVNKASGTVAMIVHAPTQRKVANVTGQQGNVLTRSFLMEYNGAATATGITTPAETWQIDFTARLTGIDEMQRLINFDNYGAGAFFGTGYLVAKTGAQFFVTKGTGYVGGIRADLPANRNITVPATATKVWADVSLQGNITSQWEAVIKITVAPTLENYSQNGFMHYVFAVASIDAAGNITDLRPKGSLSDDALAKHEQSRNHPDGTLLYKGFVQLSSATNSDSEIYAATPKAVKNAALAITNNLGDMGIGLPTQSTISNFDWQNFIFTSGGNYQTNYTSWLNPPLGLDYVVGTGVCILVDFITANATRIGLTVIPNTASQTNYRVYKVLAVGNPGSRVFTIWQEWNAAIPVPVIGGGTGGNTPATGRAGLELGNSAVRNIGTATGTVAAGDDTRIVNAISIKDTDIQLPGNLGVKNLEVYPMPGSAEGGQIDLFDKGGVRVAFIDIDSSGNTRVVSVAGGVAISINKTTGDVSIPKVLNVTGGITSAGTVRTGNGAAWLAANGDAYGAVWGGYLSAYIGNISNTAQSYGVVALARGASISVTSTLDAPAGTYLTLAYANLSSRVRPLLMQRPSGAWVQMGGDIG